MHLIFDFSRARVLHQLNFIHRAEANLMEEIIRYSDAIYRDKPDFMVWLGRQYLSMRSGLGQQVGHLSQIQSVIRLKNYNHFLANTPQYAIWDDHDYGPNDSDRSYMVGTGWTRVPFRDFWANPVYGAGDTEGYNRPLFAQ